MSHPPTRAYARGRVKSETCRADYLKVVTKRQGIILGVHVAVLCTAASIAALTSEAPHWQPVELVLLLLILAVGSEALTVELRGVRMSGSFLAIVLAMALLGPAPAVAIGVASVLVDGLIDWRGWFPVVLNCGTYAAFPLVGAGLIQLTVGDPHAAEHDALGFAAAVLVVFMVTNALNFALIAAGAKFDRAASFRGLVRSVYFTILPSEFATGLLTAGVAFSYGRLGVGAVGLLAVVLFIFQYLIRTFVNAHERGEELAKRTRELAALQVGLLSTVMQTLSMRDAMTARHSAAVARYAREVAGMLGASEREQDLIHTAALLHDIGKFIFPDSILFADRKLTDEEWETVKLHPEQGARLVRRIEGYGPVADIIYCHHERYDGNGYYNVPREKIPLGSRIIAAADTFDVMTSRDSYRRPVSSEAALAELRRVAGAQLDPVVVEAFVAMIEARRVSFQHADHADFEVELNLERRVADYASPRAAVV
jgi:putative nucleotidyltransferase with HDIG domain